MMALLFLIMLIATLSAWFQYRRAAILSFAIDLILASLWFIHHMSSALTLQL